MSKTWIRTATGGVFDVVTPKPADVRIEDIAWSLSKLCRFTGQYRSDLIYSVAEHCLRVSFRAEELVPIQELRAERAHVRHVARWGLLHDAAEAYVADLNSPTKHAPGVEGYREIEARVMAVIRERFELPGEQPPEVDQADNELYWTERRDLHGRSEEEETTKTFVAPLEHVRVACWSPGKVRRLFLKRFAELWPNEPGVEP